MNRIFLIGPVIAVCCFMITVISDAQWQSDVRLTNDPAASYVYYNWCVASGSNSVYAVWEDGRDGNNEIYFKRSTNKGQSWEADLRLTNFPGSSSTPSISVTATALHVVWEDNRDGNYEIYYKGSTDGGSSWSSDMRLTNNPAASSNSSLAVSGQNVYALWNDNRDGNIEVYCKISTNGGVSWGADTRLTNSPGQSYDPSVTSSGSGVHVVWADNRDGRNEIYYKRTTDGGLNWLGDTRLTNDTSARYNPSISVSGSVVNIVWTDNRNGNYEIYNKRSTDGGSAWGADTRLTSNSGSSFGPSTAAAGPVLHIVWEDDRDGNYEIYYKQSTNQGAAWGPDVRLTNNSSGSTYSSIAISGSALHVVWCDNRDGNWEIYYKRDTTGNPVGIVNPGTEIPTEFSLSQNFPNPFNPYTNIKFDLPIEGNTKITIYDILGRETAVIVNENLNPGSYSINFDGSNLPSGVYFYRLETGSFVEIKKMLMLK